MRQCWWLFVLSIGAAIPASAAEHAPADLPTFEGRVVLVNFWATWCGPCREELPLLDALHDRLDPRAAVVAVNVDRTETRARGVLRHLDADLPVLFDTDGAIAARFSPPVVPTSYLLDTDGRVVGTWEGAVGDDELARIEADIGALLAEEAVASGRAAALP